MMAITFRHVQLKQLRHEGHLYETNEKHEYWEYHKSWRKIMGIDEKKRYEGLKVSLAEIVI